MKTSKLLIALMSAVGLCAAGMADAQTKDARDMAYKQPVSVLVLVYTTDGHVLLIERADFPEHWQSVTGSQEPGESLPATAFRELLE